MELGIRFLALSPTLLFATLASGCGEAVTPSTPDANCTLSKNWFGSFEVHCSREFPISDRPRAVLEIASGDTLLVAGDSRRVRLLGVCANAWTDAEMEKSRARLASLVEGRFVRVRQIYTRPENMLVATVSIGDVDLSDSMLESGMATACDEAEAEASMF